MKLTLTDILIFVFLIFGLWSGLFIADMPIESNLFVKWGLLGLIYVVIRAIPNKKIILWALASAGVVQSIVAVGQQIGYVTSNHRMFDVTGLMNNPGQLGGFQAVAFIVGLLLLSQAKARVVKIVLGITGALIVYSLYLADSRASLVAMVVGVVVVCHQQIWGQITKRKWTIAPIVLLLLIASVWLFNYRSGSANARLLTWRVSADMIADKPMLGYGVGKFNDEYMLYQARYFESHPDSQFTMVADNVAYPYNEFLHILIEQGVVGLLLFIVLLIAVFATAKEERTLAPLSALLVFSMFSYPSYVLGLAILFPILLGVVDGRAVVSIKRRWACLMILIVAIILMTFAIKQIVFFRKVSEHTKVLMLRYDADSDRFFSQHIDKLYTNHRFNGIYVFWLAKYPQMIESAEFKYIIPTCENWCDIGDYYTSEGSYCKAEKYYQTAAHMIPTRLTPDYRLWKMSLKTGDYSTARTIASKILNQPLKVESTFTLRAKAEVRNWLELEQ